MGYGDAIKNGFRIINRNWQLVLIQIGAMIASFVGFFILVGFPLAVAFIIFGLDLTELSRIHGMLGTFHRPSEIISKYFGLVVLVLASIFLYLLSVMSLGVFIFGGSIGVIARSIKDVTEQFTMKRFLAEGKRLFWPLIGFTTVVGLIFIALAFVLGLFGGAIAAMVSLAKEHEFTLALFLGIFFSLILFVVGITLILGTLAVTLYGAASLTLGGTGPVKSVRESFGYLFRHAGAFYLYCIAFGGYVIVGFFLLFFGYPLKFIPLLGPLFAFFFQLTMHIGQSYLGLVMLATIFSYYSATAGSGTGEIIAVSPPVSDMPSTSEGSSPDRDTSMPPDAGQGDVPREKETP